MATTKQRQAAKRNVRKAISAAKRKRTIAHMPKRTRTALGKQAAAVRQRKRTGAKSPKTRAELMKIAQRRKLAGRSKIGRAQLARAANAERDLAALETVGFPTTSEQRSKSVTVFWKASAGTDGGISGSDPSSCARLARARGSLFVRL